MPIQNCPLCLRTTNVISSHLHPAAIYPLLRSSEDASPIRVGDDLVMHTDRQMQDYLLCPACEDILNKGGETWTIPKLATMTKSFPLYDILIQRPAVGHDETWTMYFTAENPEIDVERLTHFAMGIFWKASVHSWKGGEKSPMIQLGPYSDEIRLWLRGESSFPKNICLDVMLSRPERALIAITGPLESTRKGWRTFFLYVPGIVFNLQVGKTIEPEMRATCFHEDPTHPILVADAITDMVWQRLGKQFHESRKTKGYLAAKAARSLKRGA
jgi:hypothetical protein